MAARAILTAAATAAAKAKAKAAAIDADAAIIEAAEAAANGIKIVDPYDVRFERSEQRAGELLRRLDEVLKDIQCFKVPPPRRKSDPPRSGEGALAYYVRAVRDLDGTKEVMRFLRVHAKPTGGYRPQVLESRTLIVAEYDTPDFLGLRRWATLRELASVSILAGNRPQSDEGKTVPQIIQAEIRAMKVAVKRRMPNYLQPPPKHRQSS